MSYVSIVLGYLLMITMVYLFIRIVLVYLFNPAIVQAIRIPPIMPLIPYLPRVFNLDFLPPFYFIYWIILIAIIAIPHELFHGIFSAHNNIKIKNTGFGFFPFFLPVFLAAFVEPDEEKMTKKSKFAQMSILSSGTFANVLTAIFFFGLLWLFFSFAFSPAGIMFDSYSYSIVGVSAISLVNNNSVENVSYDNMLDMLEGDKLNNIVADGKNFLMSKSVLQDFKNKAFFEQGNLLLYDDSPAIKAGLVGAITKIDDVVINSKDKLVEELGKRSPGEIIIIETFTGNEFRDYNLTLGEYPQEEGKAWLGIGFLNRQRSGVMGRLVNVMAWFREPHVYYQPLFDFSHFIYNLLWWIVLLSISVALINMLPVGIFDGGRFFFLTIATITGSEKIAKKAFVAVTFLFLFMLALIMLFWMFSFL